MTRETLYAILRRLPKKSGITNVVRGNYGEMKIRSRGIFRRGNLFLQLLVLFYECQQISCFNSFRNFSIGDTQSLVLSVKNKELTVNLPYVVLENLYAINETYSFLIPDVTVDCQCSCTEKREILCDLDNKCSITNNSTTTCTIYKHFEEDSILCEKYLKLCCQTYFSKPKIMKSFTAVKLKYHRSLLKMKINETGVNVVIPEGVNTLFLSPDIMLRIIDFPKTPRIPESWYFIEDSSKDLFFAKNINEKNEVNLKKIGWFQVKTANRKLSKGKQRNSHFKIKYNKITNVRTEHVAGNYQENLLKAKYRDVQQQIEEKQRELYSHIQIVQAPWLMKTLKLEDITFDLILDNYIKHSVKLEDLFDKINDMNPTQILVEGNRGFGKTTLCLRLLHDWQINKEYIGAKFNMVFMFQSRDFKDYDSLEKMMKDEFESFGIDIDAVDDIDAVFNLYKKEILVILDGFDEIHDNVQKQILSTLQIKKNSYFYLLVTCQTEKFHVLKKRFNVDMDKTVLMNGVTKDKSKDSLKKYSKYFSDIDVTKENTSEIFQCPILFILSETILKKKSIVVNSKTSLYKEFFNFIFKKGLIRENVFKKDHEIEFFNQSRVTSMKEVNEFGQLAKQHLCQNKIKIDKSDILCFPAGESILKLGLFVKIPKFKNNTKDECYQPIHESFLEFGAALEMWNLFKTNVNEFIRELERILASGLRPIEESLFYVFLGGLMNNEAAVIFQCFIPYSLWFNIENIYFTNILLEIQDFMYFLCNFEPMLKIFLRSFYSIQTCKEKNDHFLNSPIFSHILNYGSDQKFIKLLSWDPKLSFLISRDVYFDHLHLYITDDICKDFQRKVKHFIKCSIITCTFSQPLKNENWKNLVCLLNLIESHETNFGFDVSEDKTNSALLELLYKELTEGLWKQKQIDRLRYELNECDDIKSISLLVDLVKREKIKKGIHIKITEQKHKKKEDLISWKSNIENLFNSLLMSKNIEEFFFINYEPRVCPQFDFEQNKAPKLALYLVGSWNVLISNENKFQKSSIEELTVYSTDDYEKDLELIQNIKNVSYLDCKLICFNSLVEMNWPELKNIKELQLNYLDQLQLKPVSQLVHLEVLTLNVTDIKTVPSDPEQFIELFSSLSLRSCEFIFIQNIELFSFFTEVLMEGLKSKNNETGNISDNLSTGSYSTGKKQYQLEELVLMLEHVPIDYHQLKECQGLNCIRSMLCNGQIRKCHFDIFDVNNVNAHQLLSLFPWNEKFRIKYEAKGMNKNCSRQSKFNYRWFLFSSRYCVKFAKEFLY